MSITLVIAEKPSVAQTIAAALGVKNKKDGYLEGGGYLISWCVGHLVQLSEAAAYVEQYRKPYRDGEEPDPYIFDGSMSIEDYELMHRLIDEERSRQQMSEQFSVLIDSRTRFETVPVREHGRKCISPALPHSAPPVNAVIIPQNWTLGE